MVILLAVGRIFADPEVARNEMIIDAANWRIDGTVRSDQSTARGYEAITTTGSLERQAMIAEEQDTIRRAIGRPAISAVMIEVSTQISSAWSQKLNLRDHHRLIQYIECWAEASVVLDGFD